MRRTVFALATVATLFACGTGFSQDTDEAVPNVEYEKLKVLEPLIGKYHEKSTGDDGVIREKLRTISWSDSQKMLVDEAQNRSAESEAELSEEEFKPGSRNCYVWNHNTGRIEYVSMRKFRGSVTTRTVKPKGNGVFEYEFISTTAKVDSTKPHLKLTATANEGGLTVVFSNRVDAEGEPMRDVEWTESRVKNEE